MRAITGSTGPTGKRQPKAYEVLEKDAAAIREKTKPAIIDSEGRPLSLPLPSLKEVVDLSHHSMGLLVPAMFEAFMTPEDREWMQGPKPGESLGDILRRMGPAREIHPTPPQQDMMTIINDLGSLNIDYMFAARDFGTRRKPGAEFEHRRANIGRVYEQVCVAVVDYMTRPPEQQSPLAKYVGQFLTPRVQEQAAHPDPIARRLRDRVAKQKPG